MAVYLSSYLLMEIIVKEFTCTMFSVEYFLENAIVQLLHGVLVQVTFHAAFLFPFFSPRFAKAFLSIERLIYLTFVQGKID